MVAADCSVKTIRAFNGQGWPKWKNSAKAYLVLKGQWKYIGGKTKPEAKNSDELEIAAAMLFMMVTEDQQKHFGTDLDNPKKMWSNFSMYQDQATMSYRMLHEEALRAVTLKSHEEMQKFLDETSDAFEKFSGACANKPAFINGLFKAFSIGLKNPVPFPIAPRPFIPP